MIKYLSFTILIGFIFSQFAADSALAQILPDAPQKPDASQKSGSVSGNETPDQDSADQNNNTNSGDWQICNQTSYVQDIANAYLRDGEIGVKGWRRLNPGACMTETSPANSPRFLYARSAPIHLGDIREWTGNIALCVSDTNFTSKAAKDCESQSQIEQDFFMRNFLAIDPSESRTDLIEAAEFGDKAQIAGLQRLLKDIGYKVTRIDGISGRRTNRTINKFKKEKSLAGSADIDTLFAALITASEAAKDNTGLKLCNESPQVIWGALASRQQGGWHSRGWWDVQPQSCTQLYNDNLKDTQMHLFALQEQFDSQGKPLSDRQLRTEEEASLQFCISEAKFSALGNEFCVENGYGIANFRAIDTENIGVKITLDDTDFVGDDISGLRR